MPEATIDRGTERDAGFALVLVMTAVMWVLEIVDAASSANLDQYGIEPRETDGLIGIAAAPFLHGGFGHLAGNTVPFVLMGFVIALSGLARVAAVTAIVALVSGAGTWLIGPDNSVHIGASGVVFGFATYLLTRGIFNRRVGEILIGAVVAAIWGGALLAGLEPQQGISWQGHLFGAVGGVVAARLLVPRSPSPGPRS